MSAHHVDCIFCNIVRHQIPATIIFDDPLAIAFLDVNPLAPGHLLVIPKDHVEQLIDLPGNIAAGVGRLLPKLGRALVQVTGASGFNVLQNNGEVAGQVVPHVHFHLIPRSAGDGLGYRWHAGTYDDNRMDQLCNALQQALKP